MKLDWVESHRIGELKTVDCCEHGALSLNYEGKSKISLFYYLHLDPGGSCIHDSKAVLFEASQFQGPPCNSCLEHIHSPVTRRYK